MFKEKDPTALISIMSRKLSLAYDFIHSRLREIGLGALDISHGDILYQLYYSGPSGMKELAEKINRDKSTVTALVDKLQKQKLVQRMPDSSDKRAFTIKLTQKGQSFRTDFIRISDQVNKMLYKGFSKNEKKELIVLVSRLGE